MLTNDARCELRQGDFFELARTGFDASDPTRKFDAVLLDIDHSPEHFLGSGSQSFYTAKASPPSATQLKPNGTFALWSNDPANEDFTDHLRAGLRLRRRPQHRVSKSYIRSTSVNSVYVAQG